MIFSPVLGVNEWEHFLVVIGLLQDKVIDIVSVKFLPFFPFEKYIRVLIILHSRQTRRRVVLVLRKKKTSFDQLPSFKKTKIRLQRPH